MSTLQLLSTLTDSCLTSSTFSYSPKRPISRTKWSCISPSASSSDDAYDSWSCSLSRRKLICDAAITLSAVSSSLVIGGSSPALGADQGLSEWERVYLPIDPGVVLLDIAFVPDDPSHGFLLGTRQTLLETKDGGSTWTQRSIASAEEEDFNYRFNSISFKGKEGWIIGKPAILLHTSDAGENWKRIPLSSQLPGDMHYQSISRKSGHNHERPRFFDSDAKSYCWAKAQTVPGRHPDRWRKDAAGNIVSKGFCGCQGCLCFEYDHIIPFSKGGLSVAANCQILQTRVNRSKADKTSNMTQLKGYSCNIKFSNDELDKIEMAVYGDVIRPGNQCRVGSIDELYGRDKAIDLIETCRFQ
ncbi:hypothetical protein Leryth_026591 [Lithospermum erythrorhizon]|nr:hypothetical protein Leryth_026591 [Lithospermum erythrorhizon]